MNTLNDLATVGKVGHLDDYYHAMPGDGQDLLRLLTAKLGDVATTPIALSAAVRGISLAVEAFNSSIEKATTELELIYRQLTELSESLYRAKSDLNLIEGSRLGRKKLFRRWQIFEEIGLAPELLDARSKEFAGAYVALLVAGKHLNKELPDFLLKLVRGDAEFLSQKGNKAIAKMRLDAERHFDLLGGPGGIPIATRLRLHFSNRIHFADDKARQAVMDHKVMTAANFIRAANKLRSLAENGDPDSIKGILASLLGVPVDCVSHVPILGPNLDEWVLAVDPEMGTIHFDLETLAPGGIRAEANEATEHSSTILVKPLPAFLFEIILRLHCEVPGAQNLGDLLQNLKKSPDVGTAYPAKFTFSCSRFAVQSVGLDIVDSAFATLDFSIVPHAKLYYRQTSRQQIWQACEKYYRVVGWGDPVPMVEGLTFGSRGVLKDEAVTRLFAELRAEVERLRPAPRSPLSDLVQFHDAFCAYSATMAVFCLALRQANPLRLRAMDVLPDHGFLLVNDKSVHGKASLQPVTITPTLARQLELWRTHCATMTKRIEKQGIQAEQAFVRLLKDANAFGNSPLFFLARPPRAVASADLRKRWPVSAPDNFGRHFWESRFPALGMTGREISAHLRHQSAGNLNWSATSDLVLAHQIARISKAQENILYMLGIGAIHGLSKRSVA